MCKTVLVAVKKPNQPLKTMEIEDTLEVLQGIVEGYIEAIYPMENLEDRSIVIFGNEEAKLRHIPSNFWLYEKKDCMCGTAIFFKEDEEGETISLEIEDIQAITEYLEKNKMNAFEHEAINKYIKENF